jgi:FKBP-type peptidyl-prolyl cis-trans isomerase FkpA
MRPYRLAALVALLAATACGDSVTDPADLTYAPGLGIDISAMTRTSSGLYYQDVTTGSGAQAASGNTVRVLYSGWLPNGTLFDEALDPNDPLVFQLGVGQVIRGWDEGIAGMRVGGTRKLVIPPDLAYGSRANGPIPANSTLVFRVQLLATQ